AAAIAGPDPQEHPVPPTLFGEKGSISTAALDRLIAAWYFLERRYRIVQAIDKNEFNKDSLVHKSWLRLGQDITLRVKQLGGDYRHIAEEIDKTRPKSDADEVDIETAAELKNSARINREKGDLAAALTDIQAAITRLEQLYKNADGDKNTGEDGFSP